MSNHDASPRQEALKDQHQDPVPAGEVDHINPEQQNGHLDGEKAVNGDLANGHPVQEEENKESGRHHSRSPSYQSERRSRERHHHRSRSRSHRSSRSPRDERGPRSDRSRTPDRRSGHDGDLGGDKEFTQVYVGRIARHCTQDDLREAFDQFGPIRDIVMKGKYAFIDFQNAKDAQFAVGEMNGKPLKGFNIEVQQSSKYKYATSSNHQRSI